MPTSPFALERSLLYDHFRETSQRGVGMTQFFPEDGAKHALYLMQVFRLLNVSKKFTPPAYFYILDTDDFEAHLTAYSSESPYHVPVAYPLISIQARTLHHPSEYSSDDSIEPHMHLLKPTISSISGNCEFAYSEHHHVFLNDARLADNTTEYSNKDYLIPWDSKELEQLLFFLTYHRSDETSYDYPACFFHAEGSKHHKAKIVPVQEVIGSLDYQLFKQFWPIFDWESLERPFTQILRPTTSL